MARMRSMFLTSTLYNLVSVALAASAPCKLQTKAMYLKALGYSLYLTGADGGEGSKKPILLKVSPEFFRIACSRPEIDVHGNLLAVHPTLVDPGMWEHLQKFVMVPKPQFQ